MNTRGLKFQLVTWYAALLTCCFLFLGAATYIVLQRYLISTLKEYQLRRGRQIGQLVTIENSQNNLGNLGLEIDSRYAPGPNERFVRVSSMDGKILYISPAPASQLFSPGDLPAPSWPEKAEAVRRIPLKRGHEMLVTSRVVRGQNGSAVLVETGAPMDDVQKNLRQWLTLLGVALPLIIIVAVAGGFLLVQRALSPVEQLVSSAERISSHNLSERLPTPQTGDELARLSFALNRVIDRLDQSLQQSRRFVADASHELRTPLTVLRGEIESLLEEPVRTDAWKDRLGSALEEVERLTNIVEGLFAISRLDAGEAQSEWVRFELGKLVSSTSDQMELLAEDKNIKVTCKTIPAVWVEGDRARLKQVIVNLLDNAIKYTPAGGAITLAVRSVDSKAIFEITDNGLGIPADALPKVFERFYRVDEARSREMGGAGLGLSIVKSICAAHHAQVQAQSKPGEGSTFRVEFPLASSPNNNGRHSKN